MHQVSGHRCHLHLGSPPGKARDDRSAGSTKGAGSTKQDESRQGTGKKRGGGSILFQRRQRVTPSGREKMRRRMQLTLSARSVARFLTRPGSRSWGASVARERRSKRDGVAKPGSEKENDTWSRELWRIGGGAKLWTMEL